MTAVQLGGWYRLRSFTVGSGMGLGVDLGGFQLLVLAGLLPGVANVISSSAAIVLVYVFVTRRTFSSRLRPATFLVFAGWYGANTLAVSALVQGASDAFGGPPLVWKLCLVPGSFVANYAFNSRLHAKRTVRAHRLRRPVEIAALAVLLLLVGALPAGAAASVPRSSAPIVSPSLQRLLASVSSGGDRRIVIGGLGSSVAVGATLPDPATEAPVAVFARALQHRVAPDSDQPWTVVNGSVSGSTIHDGMYRDWPLLAKRHPDIVVLGYGMNDGAPAQFNSGETFPGAMATFALLLRTIKASGAIPVVLTSPHPETVRFNWLQPALPSIYPAGGETAATAALESVGAATSAGGTVVPTSVRHAMVNSGMRAAADQQGVDVIDVEPLWFDAVARFGQSRLFNTGEFVHPNLLGHRESYDLAIDRWAQDARLVSSDPHRASGD